MAPHKSKKTVADSTEIVGTAPDEESTTNTDHLETVSGRGAESIDNSLIKQLKRYIREEMGRQTEELVEELKLLFDKQHNDRYRTMAEDRKDRQKNTLILAEMESLRGEVGKLRRDIKNIFRILGKGASKHSAVKKKHSKGTKHRKAHSKSNTGRWHDKYSSTSEDSEMLDNEESMTENENVTGNETSEDEASDASDKYTPRPTKSRNSRIVQDEGTPPRVKRSGNRHGNKRAGKERARYAQSSDDDAYDPEYDVDDESKKPKSKGKEPSRRGRPRKRRISSEIENIQEEEGSKSPKGKKSFATKIPKGPPTRGRKKVPKLDSFRDVPPPDSTENVYDVDDHNETENANSSATKVLPAVADKYDASNRQKLRRGAKDKCNVSLLVQSDSELDAALAEMSTPKKAKKLLKDVESTAQASSNDPFRIRRQSAQKVQNYMEIDSDSDTALPNRRVIANAQNGVAADKDVDGVPSDLTEEYDNESDGGQEKQRKKTKTKMTLKQRNLRRSLGSRKSAEMELNEESDEDRDKEEKGENAFESSWESPEEAATGKGENLPPAIASAAKNLPLKMRIRISRITEEEIGKHTGSERGSDMDEVPPPAPSGGGNDEEAATTAPSGDEIVTSSPGKVVGRRGRKGKHKLALTPTKSPESRRAIGTIEADMTEDSPDKDGNSTQEAQTNDNLANGEGTVQNSDAPDGEETGDQELLDESKEEAELTQDIEMNGGTFTPPKAAVRSRGRPAGRGKGRRWRGRGGRGRK